MNDRRTAPEKCMWCGSHISKLQCANCGARYGHKEKRKKRYDDGFHLSQREVTELRRK